MIKLIITLVLFVTVHNCGGQHIQYRDKKKPAPATSGNAVETVIVPRPDNTVKTTPPDTPAVVIEKKIVPVDTPVVVKKVIPRDTVVTPVAVIKDTALGLVKSKAALTMNPRPKKPYVEEQNVCNLTSRPELAPQLPLVINNVKPQMINLLKERYKGRLYSITGLNMIDERLKYKLKICDKDNAKFRSEYLDKNGNIVNDPDLDYD